MIIIFILTLIIMYQQITPTFEPQTPYENYTLENNIKKYKLRSYVIGDVCEVFGDVCKFYHLIATTGNRISEIKVETAYLNGFPITDFTMEFSTDMNIEKIKKILKRGQDLHIMADTLKPIELYDGERDFDW